MTQFFKEICDQPRALLETIRYSKELNLEFDSGKPCLFTGMGASFAVSQLASLLVNKYGKISFALDNAELIHYHTFPLVPFNVFVTSQSGESFEAKELVKRYPTLGAVTNNPNSFVATHADNAYYTQAGEELAIVTSKTYTTSLALWIALLSKAFGEDLSNKLITAAEVIDGALESIDEIGNKIANFIDAKKPLILIGRGPAAVIADQARLTLKETARMATDSLTCAQFRHGPFELLAEGDFQCIFFNPNGKTTEINKQLAKDIADQGGKVVYVADEALDAKNILSIRLESVDEYISPIPYALVTQVAAMKLSEAKGLIAGEPKLVTKVTEIE